MSNATAILNHLNLAMYNTVHAEVRAGYLNWAERVLAAYKAGAAGWTSLGDYAKDRKTFRCSL